MGVRGLATFIKDNRSSLCRSVQLRQDGSSTAEKTVLVVDAWGVIYQLYLSSLPWQSGGEYLRFYRIVRRLVESWRSVGLEPYFVFDGASPPEKHDTLVCRLQQQIGTARLFYTTSPASRSSSSFSRSEVILPPLASHAFIFALSEMHVKMHFVPMGEADGMCVAIAEQLGGFVLGQDSDYLILAGGDGLRRMKGYVPIDMIMWIEGDEGEWAPTGGRDQRGGGGGGGWNVAQHSRGRDQFQPRHPPLLPPTDYKSPVLVITYIPAIALRQRLRLPASILPLFASLAGNDYTPPAAHDLFFESGLRATAKIEKAARVLREQVYHPNAQAVKSANPGDHAVELVRRVVKKLLIRPLVNDAELQELVEAIIEASFQYTLPLGTDCCEQYPFCGEVDPSGCQTALSRSSSRPASRAEAASSDALSSASGPATHHYAAAQRRGLAGSITHLWLYPHRMYLWSVLEDPQQTAFKATTGLKNLRRDAFKIAAEGFGRLRWQTSPQGSDEENNADGEAEHGDEGPDNSIGDDSTEAVDSDKSHDDREVLKLLGVTLGQSDTVQSGHAADDQTLVGSEASLPTRKLQGDARPVKRVVTEYIRSGSRIVPQEHDLDLARAGDTPLCLDPIEKRLATYLRSLHSDTPAILALPAHIQPWIAILRFCAIESARKSFARGGGASGAETGKWRRTEVEAALRAGLGTYAAWEREWVKPNKAKKLPSVQDSTMDSLYPLLSTRNATLVAQITATMTDTIYLAQALLLLPDATPSPPAPDGSEAKTASHRLTHLIPFVFISGATLHKLLSGSEPATGPDWAWSESTQEVYDRCLTAFGQYMDEDVVLGWQDAPKSPRSEETDRQPGRDAGSPISPNAAKKRKNKKSTSSTTLVSGRFGLLQELSAQ